MSKNSTIIHATPEQVWAVLADGWLFPLWVVGASRMRDVEANWPAVGSKIHHSVGVWPVLIDDHSQILEADPPKSLRMKARMWPAGEAEVLITLDSASDGTKVTIAERLVGGPGLFVPRPIREASFAWRNVETLRRLGYIAENRVL